MIKNSKQRAYLKGLAMNMTPIIQIGKSSVTPGTDTGCGRSPRSERADQDFCSSELS